MKTAYIQDMAERLGRRTDAYAEIYLEKKQTTQVEETASRSILTDGAGIRLISGQAQTYVYGNDVSEAGLAGLAEDAAEMFVPDEHSELIGAVPVCPCARPVQVLTEPGTVPAFEKKRLVREVSRFLRELPIPLSSLHVSYEDVSQQICVVNSLGDAAEDRRVTGRIRVSYSLMSRTGWCEYVRPYGFEMWQDDTCFQHLKKCLEAEYQVLKADPVPSGFMPVVIGPGDGGTFWHETCGHQLEAAAIASGRSDFCGRMGEMVASDKVTLIDDGTIPGLYGSSVYDDEGLPRRKNVLIDHGRLKGYLCDRYYGGLIGMAPNGAGRRQDYTFAPVSRMSNTYLEVGEDDEDEMIREIDRGLYVAAWGGGSGGSQFSLICSRGYLIEQGKITRPVAPCLITGRGLEVIKNVDRVGRRLEYEQGSYCGAASGLVPVTAFQPMMRISGMKVDGGA